MMSDYRKVWDTATKEGDRHMRCRGGTEWNMSDLLVANDELVQLAETLRGTLYNQMKSQGQAASNETG